MNHKLLGTKISSKVFTPVDALHLVLFTVPLRDEDDVQAFEWTIQSIEPHIRRMIYRRGIDKKLRFEFDGLGIRGKLDAAQDIYMKLK